MNRQRRIFWLVVVGLVCIDWTAKIWLLSTLLCPTCSSKWVALASARAPLATQRISMAGVYYGDCAGVAFAVVLYPEPCDWNEAPPDQKMALR